MQTLSPPQRPVCVVGKLGRKKKRERGARWEGEGEKNERPLFSLFPSSPARFLFFSIIATFNRDTQREPLQRREVQTDNCQSEMVIEQLVDHPRRPRDSQSGREKGRQN